VPKQIVSKDHCVDQNTDGRNVIKYIRNVDYATDRDNAWRNNVLKHESRNSIARQRIRIKKGRNCISSSEKIGYYGDGDVGDDDTKGLFVFSGAFV
jgi:hypothetical protein